MIFDISKILLLLDAIQVVSMYYVKVQTECHCRRIMMRNNTKQMGNREIKMMI